MSRPLGFSLGGRHGTTGAVVLLVVVGAASLAAALARGWDLDAESLVVAWDAVVGVAWAAAALALWSARRTRRSAVLCGVFAVTWALGSVEPAVVLLHRGAFAHLLLAYPSGRLGSLPARGAVVAAYALGIAGATTGPAWTLAFAAGLVIATSLRWLAATGAARRSRALPLGAAVGIGAVLAAGAGAQLAGEDVSVLLGYEVVLTVASLAIAADLRSARWSDAVITGLVVDLGERPVGGLMRERLARAVGDPTLTVAYLLDESRAPVDEHGRPVELPRPDGARVVTPVDLAGRPLAVLIHDPAVLGDAALIEGAASALSVAVANARLQSEIRERVVDVQASTRRLLDAAEAERRRLASTLRAHVDPLLREADGALRTAGAETALFRRLEDVRDQLSRLAAGLDPPSLREGGLRAALGELVEHATLPTLLSVPDDERFSAAVESCVWFTCAEAVANALKHANASQLSITVRRLGDVLQVEVGDDGDGGADAERGSGLRRLAERVRAAGGQLTVESTSGRGTRVTAVLNVGGRS